MFPCRVLPSGCYIKQVVSSPRGITDHAVTRSRFTIGKCMEIIIQSIPEKNLVAEFHSRRSEIVSCDESFNLERVTKLSEL